MPEMLFRIRWPDGTAEDCYSPSLVIKDFFAPGESYRACRLSYPQPHRARDRERSRRGEIRLRLFARRSSARPDRDAAKTFAALPHARALPSRPLRADEPDNSRCTAFGRRDRRRPGRAFDQLVSDPKRHRPCCVREGARRVTPGAPSAGIRSACDAELAVPVAGLSVSRPDPHGFMLRDEIVAYMDAFVASFAPPLGKASRCGICAATRSTASCSMRPTAFILPIRWCSRPAVIRSRSSRAVPSVYPPTSCKSIRRSIATRRAA